MRDGKNLLQRFKKLLGTNPNKNNSEKITELTNNQKSQSN